MDKHPYGHTEIAVSSLSRSGMVSFFTLLGKKAERMGTAIYLITNFLNEDEPIRLRLRVLAVRLIEDIASVRYAGMAVESNVLERLQVTIAEAITLLELAFVAGILSEMNFSILKREYGSLRDSIEVKKVSRESRTDSILGNSFFDGTTNRVREEALRSGASLDVSRSSRTGEFPLPQIEKPGMEHKGHSLQKMQGGMSDTMLQKNSGGRHTKQPERTDKGHGNTQVNPQAREVVELKNFNLIKDTRRNRILKLIKDSREVTIKDITFYFPDLSEKTIQRDLITLVAENVLKKTGERRWSRYSLL